MRTGGRFDQARLNSDDATLGGPMPETKVTVPPCPFRRGGHRWLLDRERSTTSCQADVLSCACGKGADERDRSRGSKMRSHPLAELEQRDGDDAWIWLRYPVSWP